MSRRRRRLIKKEIDNNIAYTILEEGEYHIPKIIHQLWIGPKPMPSKLMDTWKDKHPDYQYIRWTEEEIKKRNFNFECQQRIDEIEEINGKADIMRWEILYHFGGIFIDADSICIEKLDDYFLRYKGFAAYENEKIRKGLIATGTMGFPKNHQLPLDAINHIKNNQVSCRKTGKHAWITVGPKLLTNLQDRNKYTDMTILPSYLFLPRHHKGLQYEGPDKIYAYQEWGSTKQNYENMNNFILEERYTEPVIKISILISSYDTKKEYIVECLNSIRNQEGHIFKEIVWINDGSNIENTNVLKKILYDFEKTTMFCKIIYSENEGNKGIGYSLNKGVKLCNNELIFKMDSDDIMMSNRLLIQLEMMKDATIAYCGGQMNIFENNRIISKTKHPTITWDEYKRKKEHWIANHPTLCFRKSAILEVGNYNIKYENMLEDFDLELRLLKKYKKLVNTDKILTKYRKHENQITKKTQKSREKFYNLRNKLIENYITL